MRRRSERSCRRGAGVFLPKAKSLRRNSAQPPPQNAADLNQRPPPAAAANGVSGTTAIVGAMLKVLNIPIGPYKKAISVQPF